MTVVLKILGLIVGIIVGVAFMRYNYPLTQLFGYNSLAEKYLGQGGTYSMWKLLGIVVILVTIWLVFR